MSEPCKHEREFAGTQHDTLTSFVKTSGELVKMTAERDEALATLERVKAIVYTWKISSPRIGTHWEGCDKVHSDCMVLAINAALEGKAPQ